MERVHTKLQLQEEQLLRDRRLSARTGWIQLLATIDGPPSVISRSSQHAATGDSPKHKPPIVDELQWKSSQVPIPASRGFQLPIKLDAKKGELHYSFSTKDYDVDFGVQMICADGSLTELLGTRRYESQKEQVKGQLDLKGPGLVLLMWDNSFSWVNTKRLAYHVELKQEALPVSDAAKTQLALSERLKREKKLVETTVECDQLNTQLQTEAQTIDLLRYQIEELQLQMRQHEEVREITQKKKEKVGDCMKDLCWELQALSWRCLDQATLHRIFDFLTEEDLSAWMLTSKKWYDRGRAYQAKRIENRKSSDALSKK